MNGSYPFLFFTVYVPLLGEQNTHTRRTEALLIASKGKVLEVGRDK